MSHVDTEHKDLTFKSIKHNMLWANGAFSTTLLDILYRITSANAKVMSSFYKLRV